MASDASYHVGGVDYPYDNSHGGYTHDRNMMVSNLCFFYYFLAKYNIPEKTSKTYKQIAMSFDDVTS